jgi:hypothetical protein
MLVFLARHLLRDVVRFLGIQFMRLMDMIRSARAHLQAFERGLLRLQIVLVLFVVGLVTALLNRFRIYRGDLPWQLYGNLLGLRRQLVYL